MFGKTKDIDDRTDLESGEFFGDEAAAAETVRLDEIIHRVGQVEQQVNSQFTSLAAYAQIAQQQIETARSEAKHATERAERRVTELIERERADRISAIDGPGSVADGSGWTAPDVAARLDTLERSVSAIQHGLNECLARQKALADAITALFQPQRAKAMGEDEESTDDEASDADEPMAASRDDVDSDGGPASGDEEFDRAAPALTLDAMAANETAENETAGNEMADDEAAFDAGVDAEDLPVLSDRPALSWPDTDESAPGTGSAENDETSHTGGIVPPPPLPGTVPTSVEPIGGLSLL